MAAAARAHPNVKPPTAHGLLPAIAMDLTSDHPWWLVRNGLVRSHPPLEQDQKCDVAVVGAGVSGALVADRLTRLGLSVVVLDRRDAGTGSTAASTGLLQYEIDVPLVELIETIGRADAERAYRLSWDSIDRLEEVAGSLDVDCGFLRRTSLYRATDEDGPKLLAAEARARQACGIDVRLLDAGGLAEEFHVEGTAALVSDQAASVDPHRLTHGLLDRAVAGGARIFDRTEVTAFECRGTHVRLPTDRGPVVTAGRVVVATGYEASSLLREKVVDLRSTYAVVSQPLDSVFPWDPRWIMWETGDPYLYLRVTDDGRLLAGGEDDGFRSPTRRDARVEKKGRRIHEKVRALLPDLDWDVEFAWAGTFGTTDDGLAYIGPTDEYPGCWFALGFGGNGITFSQVAADMLGDMLTGEDRPDAHLFRFGR